MDEKRARFEAVVLPHLDAAYRFARWLSHSPGDASPGEADDVVQDADAARLSRVRRPARLRREGVAARDRQELPLHGGQTAASDARSCRCRRRHDVQSTATP
jgi:hypothetical protein